MRKSKSFDLVSDDDIRKRDRLYEAQKCRWFQCLAIPALLGFILLLILCNVDFSSNENEISGTSEKTIHKKTKTRGFPIIEKLGVASSIQCKALDSTSKCNITCKGGKINNDLGEVLENLQKECNDRMDVVLQNSVFPYGWMDRKIFNGNFSMNSLSIIDCDLQEIDKGVFVKNSTQYIITLSIVKSQFSYLRNYTFAGLNSVQYFQLINYERLLSFDAVKFLQPMAGTLMDVIIMHKNIKHPANNLMNWLEGADFKQLQNLNLSHTLFGDKLTKETFISMPVLKVLILSHCGINSVGVGTFENVIYTLNYLDLSNNPLKVLNVDFLAFVNVKSFKFEIHNNPWDCSCENFDLIYFIQHTEIKVSEDPKCSTPEDLTNKTMAEILIDCRNLGPTTLKIVSDISTDDLPITTASVGTTDASSTYQTDESNTSTASYTITLTSDTQTPELSSTTEISVSRTTAVRPTKTVPTTPMETIPTTPMETIPTTTRRVPTTTTEDPIQTTETYPTTPQTSDPPQTEQTRTTPGTIGPMTTTSRPTPRPTPPSINLYCQNTIAVNKEDAKLNIATKSKRSVLVDVNSSDSDLSLIYFSERDTKKYLNTTTIYLNRSILIDLNYDESYEFCIIKGSTQSRISPFNCRAHYLEKEAWLMLDDVDWFVAVNVVGPLLTFMLASVLMYFLLRWQPTFVRGNDRFVRSKTNSKIMILFPQSDQSPSDSQSVYEELPDYEKPKNERYDSVHSDDSQPPYESAPSVPKAKKINPKLTQSTIPFQIPTSSKTERQCQKVYEEIY